MIRKPARNSFVISVVDVQHMLMGIILLTLLIVAAGPAALALLLIATAGARLIAKVRQKVANRTMPREGRWPTRK